MSWKGNWIAFLDGLLQPLVVNSFSTNLRIPVEIEKIEIDPKTFLNHVEHTECKSMTATNNHRHSVCYRSTVTGLTAFIKWHVKMPVKTDCQKAPCQIEITTFRICC